MVNQPVDSRSSSGNSQTGRTRLLVSGVAAVALLVGLLPAVAGSANAAAANEPGTLVWTDCPKEQAPTQQCATLDVPLDYDRPSRGTVTLAIVRVPATGPDPVGSLFFNPGGPGGSGVAALAYEAGQMSAEIKQQFHIVSWDPRGIGETTPTLKSCDSPFPVLPTTGKVNWTKALDRTSKQLRKANRACQRKNSAFIDYLGTRNVVRDLNRMRAAVGDQKLTYHGASYGTRIGYTYAAMFPNKVRAMVLDGNINPSGSYANLSASAVGPDLALDFVKKYAPDVFSDFKRGDRILRDKAITVAPGVKFTRWDYRELTTKLLSKNVQISQIPFLAQKVQVAAAGGEGSQAAKETLAGLIPTSNSNAGGPFSVVNCLDYADRPGKKAQANAVTDAASQGPLGGQLALSYAPGCAGLDLKPEPVPDMSRGRLRDKVADIPVVISNATKDVYTPKFWAKQMKKAFKTQTFIQRHGTQHVIWGGDDNCVGPPIDSYVLTRQLPFPRTCAWPGVLPTPAA